MAAERIIGVDFGTSTSVIRVKRYENGQPIGERLEAKEVIFGDRALVPTVISKKDDGGSVPYFGYEAQPGKKNHTYYHSFKMDLESSDPEKRAQARELTEEFFCFLGKKYKSQSDGGHLGNADDEERTIVSYPVKWNEGTKNFMLKAAAKAGFPNVTGMDEAQAAIQAVIVMNADHLHKNGLLQNSVGSNVLLIDMGAGTTDLVLARYTPGDEDGVEVLNTWPKSGEIQFGGREIDHLLQNYFRQMMDENVAETILTKVSSDKFKSWKEANVSPSLRENDSVDSFNELDTLAGFFGLDLDYCLDRAAFENCLADYLKQFPQLINGCLQNAGMTGNDVDLVIVTGGHSQWYFVSEMLKGKMSQFGEVDLPKIKKNHGRIIPISRPQETVALGLAYNGIHDTHEKKPTPPITDKISTPTFTMEISQIFSKSGGTCVGGTISLGEVSTGDIVHVWDKAGENLRSVNVNLISLSKQSGSPENNTVGTKNDFAVLLLEGVKEAELSRGMILFKDTNEFRHAPLQWVQESVESWMRQNVMPGKTAGTTFTMEIIQKFSTPGGTCVSGVISEGEVSVGDVLLMWDAHNMWDEHGENVQIATDVNCLRNLRSVKVKKIEFKKNGSAEQKQTAAENESVVLLLDGIKEAELYDGLILFKDTNDGYVGHAPLINVQQSVERWKKRQPVVSGPGPDVDDDAYTPESEFEIGSVDGTVCSIKKYLGNRIVVKIPPTIRGRKVVSIDKLAFGGITIFQGNSTIEKVIIPETVRTIGYRAFSFCRHLRVVIAHKNIVSIGAEAFMGCNSLLKMDFDMGDCAEGHVIFPPNLKSIGATAFVKDNFHLSTCIFKEVQMSKQTKVKDIILQPKNFNPRDCAVFYYD